MNISISNIYSIFISSYICNLYNNPIIILYDDTNKSSIYFSLLIQNRILIILPMAKIYRININNLNISNLDTKQNQQYVLLDCIYDIDILIKFINTELKDLICLYKIITIINYYKIDSSVLKKSFDIFYKCVFINIIDNLLYKKLDNKFVNDLVYKTLDRDHLLDIFVIPSVNTLNNFIEIQNNFVVQHVSEFYGIYFLKNKMIESFNYVNKWIKFDQKLIKYINDLDEFENIFNYYIVNDSNIVYNNYMTDAKMINYLKKFPINYLSNYNNKLYINSYFMDNFNGIINLTTSSQIIDNTLTQSIYKINDKQFIPSINLLIDDKTSSTPLGTTEFVQFPSTKVFGNLQNTYIQIMTKDNTYNVSLDNIIRLFEIIDIYDLSNKYKLIIYTNFKFNLISEFDINYLDEYLHDLTKFNINILIISVNQFKLTRYNIIDNQIKIDSLIDYNSYYNPVINSGDYLSQLYFNQIEINHNQFN